MNQMTCTVVAGVVPVEGVALPVHNCIYLYTYTAQNNIKLGWLYVLFLMGQYILGIILSFWSYPTVFW